MGYNKVETAPIEKSGMPDLELPEVVVARR